MGWDWIKIYKHAEFDFGPLEIMQIQFLVDKNLVPEEYVKYLKVPYEFFKS